MELFDLTFSCYGYGIDAITTNRIQIVGNIVNLQGKYLWLFFSTNMMKILQCLKKKYNIPITLLSQISKLLIAESPGCKALQVILL